MTELATLLNTPGLRSTLAPIVAGEPARRVRGVALIDQLDELQGLPADDLAVLTPRASAEADGYRLDMALRVAIAREAAGLVFSDGRTAIPPTAAAIAERAGFAILRSVGETDLAGLVIALSHHLAGSAEATLALVQTALDTLTAAEARGARVDELLAVGSDAVDVTLEVRESRPGDISACLLGDGDAERAICAQLGGSADDPAVRIIVHLVAGAVGRTIEATRRAEEVPLRSRGVLLAQFLLAGPDRADRLLDRLRAAEIPIDGQHAVIRLEVDQQAGGGAPDELVPIELTERVGRLALEEARAGGGVWNLTQVGTALLLVRMDASDRRQRAAPDATSAARRIVTRLEQRVPGLSIYCGVGTTHPGPTGLRTSAAEAHTTASAARAMRRASDPVSFDEVGLRRTLIEWYASDTAREAVDAILEPLDRLGGQRKDVALETLRSYLDNQSSLARTATELNLHRNAVAYRIRWIFDALGADPEDPETRLMLQLACRARSLV